MFVYCDIHNNLNPLELFYTTATFLEFDPTGKNREHNTNSSIRVIYIYIYESVFVFIRQFRPKCPVFGLHGNKT